MRVYRLYFPSSVTPISMTHQCNLPRISNRFLLGECTGKHCSKVDVILNLLGATWSISVEGKVAKIELVQLQCLSDGNYRADNPPRKDLSQQIYR